MRITFNDGTSVEVVSVHYTTDENYVPIDIVIYGTKESLLSIDAHAHIASTIREAFPEEYYEHNRLDSDECELYAALYARMDSFNVSEFSTVTWK